eukprot:982604-Rhodomonas_salina.2
MLANAAEFEAMAAEVVLLAMEENMQVPAPHERQRVLRQRKGCAANGPSQHLADDNLTPHPSGPQDALDLLETRHEVA